MRKAFKSIITKDDDGWMMCLFGKSGMDDKSYTLTTERLHADQVPLIMADAKSASEFMAGLLNCYFNKVNALDKTADQICLMGVVDQERTGIYENPNQKEMPF